MFLVTRYEEGEYWSTTLREIFSEIHGIQIGIGSYGCFRPDAFPRGTVIGNYCSIAANVRFIGSNHPIDFASTHPMFYYPSLGFVDREKITRNNTVVGHDVWIGYNSLILANCRQIGTGAVIAAGSVVTRDVEPYTIIAGVPAKPIKKRFSNEIAEELTESEWYLLNPDDLAKIASEVKDPSKFLLALKTLRH